MDDIPSRLPLRALARALMLLVAGLLPPAALAQAAAEAGIEAAGDTDADPWQARQNQRVLRGDELLKQHQPEAAIREAFDPIIQDHEARHPAGDTVYFCVRTPAEALFYLTGLAAAHDRNGQGRTGVALASTWAYGYYGKAFALIELNRFDEAAEALDRALELSPANSQFLTERGYLYRASREWDKMLASNQAALEHLEFSPDAQRDTERARALRGAGYALIELDRLDEAERHFRDSLKIEPGNPIALGELDYIRKLRKKQP